jgi:hypothetical protein
MNEEQKAAAALAKRRPQGSDALYPPTRVD